MKAAVFFQPGGPEQIQIAEVPRPDVGPDQVLIEVKACALNHFDLLVLREANPDSTVFPFWGGADIAGIIAEVGSSVAKFKNGDRVTVNPSLYCGDCEHCIGGQESQCDDYGITGDSIPGGMAEFISVNARDVMLLPETLSFEEAAAAPLVYQTAWRALMSQAQIRAGEDVLILGASGGVGSASIQIAKLAGANVIAVTSSTEKEAYARQMGADHVLNRTKGDYWSELAALTNNRGVDVVVENTGAATWSDSLESLVKGGRLVTYGRTTGSIAETDIRLIFWHHLRIIGSTMANRKEFAQVMRLIFKGKLKPVVDSVYPLQQAGRAYQHLLNGEHFGKVVISMEAE
ncbi:MAG: zinc-binding dehydrogenase [Gammaproteobacteria bacterium]|nr:zinc-binding dehydrogenase [Gammaproteobacteria bacterium]